MSLSGLSSRAYREETYTLRRWVEAEQLGESPDRSELANVRPRVLQRLFGAADMGVFLYQREKRQAALNRANAVGSRQFQVVEEGPAGVAGAADMSERVAYMMEDTLEDERWALHVAYHESVHLRSGIRELDVYDHPDVLSLDQINALEDFLAPHLPDEFGGSLMGRGDFLMEGFTEWITISNHSYHEKCAYNKGNVPAANALQQYAMEHLGISLGGLFLYGEEDAMWAQLALLATHLITREDTQDVLDEI